MTGYRNVRFSTQPAEKYKKSIEKLPETSENQVSFGACLGHSEISGSFCAFGGFGSFRFSVGKVYGDSI